MARRPPRWASALTVCSSQASTRSPSPWTQRISSAANRQPLCATSFLMTAPTRPQSVQGTLPLKPAQISLAGAPADGRLSCPDLRVEIGAGEVAQVSVAEVSTPHSCMVWGGGLPARQAVGVDVRAGTVNYVRWPASP